jgi:hypothetical protein
MSADEDRKGEGTMDESKWDNWVINGVDVGRVWDLCRLDERAKRMNENEWLAQAIPG